jgi:hypothetical protein
MTLSSNTCGQQALVSNSLPKICRQAMLILTAAHALCLLLLLLQLRCGYSSHKRLADIHDISTNYGKHHTRHAALPMTGSMQCGAYNDNACNVPTQLINQLLDSCS